MKLIRELIEDVEYVTEERDGQKHLYIKGVFLQAAVPNRNRRIYPESVMDEEVARYIKAKVEKNMAFGELGHPAGPQINLDRVSHVITELKKDGTNYVGKARIVNEGLGKIARGIIEAGGQLGVSSRGLGALRKRNDGLQEVEKFHLATGADIVADPSAPDAYVQGVMEQADWVMDPLGEWHQEVRQDLRKMTVRQIDESKVRMLEQFIHRLGRAKYNSRSR